MSALTPSCRIYDGDGDILMTRDQADVAERILLQPDALPSREPDPTPRIRILWGQHLLEDLLQGRYRTLVCAVNADDNSRGIIAQIATLLPTSQWDLASVTEHARHFASSGGRVKVLKYDMDLVEILAVLRPAEHAHLSIDHLSKAFQIVSQMIHRRPARWPSASVSFLGARANVLVDRDGGNEPSFETVLRTMYQAGYHGDVYPAPAMWHAGHVGLFARYPFTPALDKMREGGF